MRHFEQLQLISEDLSKTVFERRWNTGEVEWWGIIIVNFTRNGQTGQGQMPFKIEAATRDEAFENFAASFEACKPSAEREILGKMNQQAKRDASKIILANALPQRPVLQ